MASRSGLSSVCRLLATTCLALVVTAAGCSIGQEWVGSPLPEEQFQLLRQGMSKVEVLGLLGPPDTAGLRLNGSVFIYRYQSSDDMGIELSAFRTSVQYDRSDRRTDRLVVFFDKKGVVTEFVRDR